MSAIIKGKINLPTYGEQLDVQVALSKNGPPGSEIAKKYRLTDSKDLEAFFNVDFRVSKDKLCSNVAIANHLQERFFPIISQLMIEESLNGSFGEINITITGMTENDRKDRYQRWYTSIQATDLTKQLTSKITDTGILLSIPQDTESKMLEKIRSSPIIHQDLFNRIQKVESKLTGKKIGGSTFALSGVSQGIASSPKMQSTGSKTPLLNASNGTDTGGKDPFVGVTPKGHAPEDVAADVDWWEYFISCTWFTDLCNWISSVFCEKTS